LFGDDVDDDLAGATVVDCCRAVRVVARARKVL
jgi:hypothetical protein